MEENVTLLAAFGAGLLSFISPCVLPLIPGYLSYVSGLSLDEMRGGAVVTSGGAAVAAICASCAEVCEMCADECDRHSHMAHCRVCAEACRKCATECRRMAGSMQGQREGLPA